MFTLATTAITFTIALSAHPAVAQWSPSGGTDNRIGLMASLFSVNALIIAVDGFAPESSR